MVTRSISQIGCKTALESVYSISGCEAAQHRLHLTAFGAVRGGHLVEKVVFGSVVLL